MITSLERSELPKEKAVADTWNSCRVFTDAQSVPEPAVLVGVGPAAALCRSSSLHPAERCGS